MKSKTSEILIEILREHGKCIYKNVGRFKSILLDYGVSKKEINLLIEITKPAYFKVFSDTLDKQNCELEKIMLLNSVQDEYDFDEEYAIDGVRCWANAFLGVTDSSSTAKRKNAADAYYDVSQVAAAAAIDIKDETDLQSTTKKTDSNFENIYNLARNNNSESDTMLSKIAKIVVEENIFHNNAAAVQDKAKNGDSQARYNLAQMYETGRGVTQSYREAIKWYKMAAIIGNIDAVYRLGQIYEQGKIVPKNIDESIRWYKIAKEKGHADGARKLKQLRREKSWFF